MHTCMHALTQHQNCLPYLHAYLHNVPPYTSTCTYATIQCNTTSHHTHARIQMHAHTHTTHYHHPHHHICHHTVQVAIHANICLITSFGCSSRFSYVYQGSKKVSLVDGEITVAGHLLSWFLCSSCGGQVFMGLTLRV